MTRDELWAIYCRRNPSFAKASGNVALSTAGIKKLFESAYNAGNENGLNGLTPNETEEDIRETGSANIDALKRAFGMK